MKWSERLRENPQQCYADLLREVVKPQPGTWGAIAIKIGEEWVSVGYLETGELRFGEVITEVYTIPVAVNFAVLWGQVIDSWYNGDTERVALFLNGSNHAKVLLYTDSTVNGWDVTVWRETLE